MSVSRGCLKAEWNLCLYLAWKPHCFAFLLPTEVSTQPVAPSIHQPATASSVCLCTASSWSHQESCSQVSACHQGRAPPLPSDSFFLASDVIYIYIHTHTCTYLCMCNLPQRVWEEEVPSGGMLSPARRDPCPPLGLRQTSHD